MPTPIPGTTVSGIVTAVNGSNVSLANGLVFIDVSHATITDDHGAAATIKAGSVIFAVLQSSTSLVASSVVVTSIPQVTLTGPVQAVNASAGTLQVLGLTIRTDSNTSFGGGHIVKGLSDIAVNDTVIVAANSVPPTPLCQCAGQLLATSILVFPSMPQMMPTLLHGTVKTIGTDSWVITDSHKGDTTVQVNAQTRIIGSPKVGDTVDVLATIDSAHNYVAISISVSPSSVQIRLSGVVKMINPNLSLSPCPQNGCVIAFWVIGPAAGLGPDFIVNQNAQTQLVGSPKVGDKVEVVMTVPGNTAVSITKQ
jgi:uncharacterized protein DUF5666